MKHDDPDFEAFKHDLRKIHGIMRGQRKYLKKALNTDNDNIIDGVIDDIHTDVEKRLRKHLTNKRKRGIINESELN